MGDEVMTDVKELLVTMMKACPVRCSCSATTYSDREQDVILRWTFRAGDRDRVVTQVLCEGWLGKAQEKIRRRLDVQAPRPKVCG